MIKRANETADRSKMVITLNEIELTKSDTNFFHKGLEDLIALSKGTLKCFEKEEFVSCNTRSYAAKFQLLRGNVT